MNIEIRTLLVADMLVIVTLAVALQFYRAHQRTYPGFGWWVLGTWIMAGGYAGLALRGIVPEVLGIVASNVAFTLTAVVRLDGTVRFTEGRPASRWLYAVPIVATALCVWPSSLSASASHRSLVVGITVALISCLIAFQFIRHAPADRGLPYRIIGSLHLVFAATVMARAVTWLGFPRVGLLQASPFHAAFFLGVTFFEIVWCVAFTTMNGNRLEAELRDYQQRLSATIDDLQKALGEVRTLSGLLPVCSWCRRIRDDAGYWKRLEEYLEVHSGVEFSHGLCPDCAEKHFPEVFGPDRRSGTPRG